MTDLWNLKKFGDCANLIRDTIAPEAAQNVPYIGLEHIIEGGLTLSGHGFSDDVISAKNRFKKDDILFGKLRPYFRKVIIAPFDGVCSTDIWVVRAKPGIDQRFLFYWMASLDFVEEATRASEGTKMPRAKWEFVAQIEKEIPLLPTQRTIAFILGSLDDKIEVNRKMNETLEAIARVIFQSWFVTFDPVRARAESRQPEGMDVATAALFPSEFEDIEGSEVPKGWGIGSLSSIIDLIGGGTPQTSVEEYWNGDIPWFSVIDAPQESDVFVIDTEKHITQAGVENSSTNILPVETTIITARGTVGKLALVGTPMAMNQSCYGARGTAGYSNYFVHFQLRRAIADLQQQTHGTVFETITRQTFDSVKIVIPPAKIARKYDQAIRGDLEKILNNLLESRTLATLRDSLLPRLMSGDIITKDRPDT